MVLIRIFEPADIARILRIERQSFGVEMWTRDMLLWYAGACPSLFLVALDRAKVAGYSIAITSGSAARLDSIAVGPASRGRGVGSALVRATLARLRRRRIHYITLMVRRDNADAIRLYKRFGFRRTATIPRYYQDGATAWRMKLILRSADHD